MILGQRLVGHNLIEVEAHGLGAGAYRYALGIGDRSHHLDELLHLNLDGLLDLLHNLDGLFDHDGLNDRPGLALGRQQREARQH